MSRTKAPHKGTPPTHTATVARYLLKKELEAAMDTNKQGGTRKPCYPIRRHRGLPRNKERREVEEGRAVASPVDGQKRVIEKGVYLKGCNK